MFAAADLLRRGAREGLVSARVSRRARGLRGSGNVGCHHLEVLHPLPDFCTPPLSCAPPPLAPHLFASLLGAKREGAKNGASPHKIGDRTEPLDLCLPTFPDLRSTVALASDREKCVALCFLP